MRFGATFPQAEISADPREVKGWATMVEALGYDHVLAYDHVAGAHPDREDKRAAGWPRGAYDHESLFHEPLVLFGYLAAVTSRVELVTGVLILPQRQTLLVAKQLAEIDVLSGGRVRAGVGLGWNHVEYEALGASFETRGRRIAEQVEVMRRLWTEPVVEFSGSEHTISRAGINPLPVRRPIPVWFGGRVEAALRRAARIGDGWISSATAFADGVEDRIAILRAELAAAGRLAKEFGIEGRIALATTGPDGWRHELARWQELGADNVTVTTTGAELALDSQLALLMEFRDVASGMTR